LITHIDFYDRFREIVIDGLTAAGVSEPLMRRGEWSL
jgi:hypothetical protein